MWCLDAVLCIKQFYSSVRIAITIVRNIHLVMSFLSIMNSEENSALRTARRKPQPGSPSVVRARRSAWRAMRRLVREAREEIKQEQVGQVLVVLSTLLNITKYKPD